MKAPRVSEAVEQSHIVQVLRTIGADVWVIGTKRRKTDYHGTMQTAGLPDVLACLPLQSSMEGGRWWLAVECKAKGGRLRPEQAHFKACCEASMLYHIVGGFDDVLHWLVTYGYLTEATLPHYRRA